MQTGRHCPTSLTTVTPDLRVGLTLTLTLTLTQRCRTPTRGHPTRHQEPGLPLALGRPQFAAADVVVVVVAADGESSSCLAQGRRLAATCVGCGVRPGGQDVQEGGVDGHLAAPSVRRAVGLVDVVVVVGGGGGGGGEGRSAACCGRRFCGHVGLSFPCQPALL